MADKVFISQDDQYLFAQGSHYDIYKKLGAHVCKKDGKSGVYFAVWAPNAVRVSVVGDFNNWDGRRHQMRRLEEGGISLEESFKLYKKGMELIKACDEKIDRVEKQILILEEENGDGSDDI